MMMKMMMLTATYLMIMVSMAFFTLLERKILGYAQTRKGPNKVSIAGVPQPYADALKLFTKEELKPQNSNPFLLKLAPFMNIALALLFWSIMPTPHPFIHLNNGIILFLAISSLMVYTTLLAGWTSNSKYALLGAYRSMAQTISYEISMSLILITIIMINLSYNPQMLVLKNMMNPWLITPLLLFVWFTTMLAESNRAPFDFAEGESELVSGFNTEYSSGMFAFIFMAEYMNIIFMSLMTSILCFQTLKSDPLLTMTTKTLLMSVIFLITRATLPRLRYDRLMNLTWTSFLPMSLSVMMLLLLMLYDIKNFFYLWHLITPNIE